MKKEYSIIINKVNNTHGYIELANGERIGRGWFTDLEWNTLNISSKLEYTVDKTRSLITINNYDDLKTT